MGKKALIERIMPAGSPDWNVRRAMAFMVMLFCFAMIPLGAFVVISDARADTLMTNSFTVLGGLVAVYIGAAVVDDHYRRRSWNAMEPGERIEETTETKSVVKTPLQAPATEPVADPAPDDLPNAPPRQLGAG